MQELIFGIGDIFNSHNQKGCLTQYNAELFHIPAYQRGYKWESSSNGAVTILLNDLWSAFESGRKEYYLQYITIKPVSTVSKKWLEVIDGQQRITTLSIIISALSMMLKKDNVAAGKLDYAIRDNFFTDHIYSKSGLEKLVSRSWEELCADDKFNKQDIFYLFTAAKKCYDTFRSDLFRDRQESFYRYLLDNVKLIVNSVEPHIESEIVFRNLNSNKVPLTESELIKGLLITKVGREWTTGRNRTFHEIMELRSAIGRIWDELTNWSNTPEINSFYFNGNIDGMHELLKLTALKLNEKSGSFTPTSSSKEFPLFNFYLKNNSFYEAYTKLLEIKSTLENWFNKTQLYNLIGFNRFSKSSPHNALDYIAKLLSCADKAELMKTLKADKEQLLKIDDIDSLNYTETPNTIHRVLLAINVFVEGQEHIRFDFYNLVNQNWSLEHVFPQTPEGKDRILTAANIKAIRSILGSSTSTEVERVLSLPKREEHEKEIYYRALREHPALNSIGNMCLLARKDNSSNGNMFFDEKRINILGLIQRGSFVPKHTFDVFAKMFNGSDTSDMTVWTDQDIKSNKQQIADALKKILGN